MNGSETIYPETEGLPCYANEPEKIGLVQPYGVLLVLSVSDLTILQVSANVSDFLKILPQALIGQAVDFLFEKSSVELLQQCLLEDELFLSPLRLSLHTLNQLDWDGMLSRNAHFVFLELEPVQAAYEASLTVNHLRLRNAIRRLQQIVNLQPFLQQAAAEIRTLTGFDRVIIYQFDPQAAGEVIAEAKREDLFSYLGMHYPATDIPELPRQLYRQGLVRYIPRPILSWFPWRTSSHSSLLT
jgi:two-component system, chemotaxis family, sensor kinase Cph1